MILAPFTRTPGTNGQSLRDETREALEQCASEPITWAEIDPARDQHYSQILVEAWAQPGDLIIIEHDIVIHDKVLPGFAECRQPWCGNPYAIGEQLIVCLGCTRFTAHLKASLPGLMAEAAAVGSEQDGGGVPAGNWRRMDIRIGALLEAHGHNRHRHEPAVGHLHRYP